LPSFLCPHQTEPGSSAYHFRTFTGEDLPRVARWLAALPVVRWWGDPKKLLALVNEDLDEPLMRRWLVEHEGAPVGALIPAVIIPAAATHTLKVVFWGEGIVQTREGPAVLMGFSSNATAS
jgi:hypothetical protein